MSDSSDKTDVYLLQFTLLQSARIIQLDAVGSHERCYQITVPSSRILEKQRFCFIWHATFRTTVMAAGLLARWHIKWDTKDEDRTWALSSSKTIATRMSPMDLRALPIGSRRDATDKKHLKFIQF